MTRLVTARALHGRPVVTVRGGEDVAEVRDVIYDPEAGRVVGFTLNKRGHFAGRSRDVLEATSIHAVGTDAVMVLDRSSLSSPDAAPDHVARPPAERDVLGNEVLTAGGVRLGEVRDLVLRLDGDMEVVGYEIKRAEGTAYIPLPAQLAVSGAVLVVPDLVEGDVQDDLDGLDAAVDALRARKDRP